MATFNTFEEITAWQRAKSLCERIHSISITTGLSKDYKLKDQINGSSGSIMDNIAEGFGRVGNKEFIQFLGISLGSACECQSQLHRIFDRNYINKALFEELYYLCDEIRRMIFGLIRYIQTSRTTGLKFQNRKNDNSSKNYNPTDIKQ